MYGHFSFTDFLFGIVLGYFAGLAVLAVIAGIGESRKKPYRRDHEDRRDQG